MSVYRAGVGSIILPESQEKRILDRADNLVARAEATGKTISAGFLVGGLASLTATVLALKHANNLRRAR